MDVLCGAQVTTLTLKRTLRVKSSTNTCLLYMETGRFPPSVFINMCIVKFWLKILKNYHAKLISAAYAQLMQDPDKYAWVKCTRDLLAPMVLGMFGEINL